jgi:hypothetical protein
MGKNLYDNADGKEHYGRVESAEYAGVHAIEKSSLDTVKREVIVGRLQNPNGVNAKRGNGVAGKGRGAILAGRRNVIGGAKAQVIVNAAPNI